MRPIKAHLIVANKGRVASKILGVGEFSGTHVHFV